MTIFFHFQCLNDENISSTDVFGCNQVQWFIIFPLLKEGYTEIIEVTVDWRLTLTFGTHYLEISVKLVNIVPLLKYI